MNAPKQQTYLRADFEQDLAEVQTSMYGYIISLLGADPDSHDVLQGTNLFLCERWTEFKPGTSFKSWAFRVAYFKSLGCRRDRLRRDEVELNEQTLFLINQQADALSEEAEERLTTLRNCLAKLTHEDRELLAIRYSKGNSLSQFALQRGKSIDAVHKTVSRIRVALRTCVERNLNRS